MKGIVDGCDVAFGASSWIKSSGFKINQRLEKIQKTTSSEGLGSSLLAHEGRTIALFTFRNDDLRTGADTLVTSLMASGVEVQILSGDQQLAVERFEITRSRNQDVEAMSTQRESTTRGADDCCKIHFDGR